METTIQANREFSLRKSMYALLIRAWNHRVNYAGDVYTVKEFVYTFFGCVAGLAFVITACYILN